MNNKKYADMSFLEDKELKNNSYLLNHHLSFILSDYLWCEIILMCFKKYKINPTKSKNDRTGFLTVQVRPMYY